MFRAFCIGLLTLSACTGELEPEPEDDKSLDDLAAIITPGVAEVGKTVSCGSLTPVEVPVDISWWLEGANIGDGESIEVPDAVGSELECRISAEGLDGVVEGLPALAEIVRVFDRGNILVIIVDDVGVDRINGYGMGENMSPTPNIDQLISEGMRFTRAWSMPTCSPTRATLMTGRHGFRTGFGKASNAADGYGLPLSEVTIAEVLDDAEETYATAAVGKWHLSNFELGHGRHPLLQGFDHHRGNLGNLRWQEAVDQQTQAFYTYEYSDDGEISRRNDYLTTSEADDTIEFMQTLPEPWFIYSAFHSAHSPAHIPPRDLYTGPELIPGEARGQERFDAMIEALDTEIGRILDNVPSDTTVIFLSDNGTEPDAAAGPYERDQVKLTMFEGGIRIPLVVRGPMVEEPGSTCDALVHTVDIFHTVAELAGAPLDQVADRQMDGVSFLPYLIDRNRPRLRQRLYTERFIDNGFGPYTEHKRSVRDDRFKLLWDQAEGYSLYDVGTSWFDGPNLLNSPPLGAQEQAALVELTNLLDGDDYRR